MVIGQPVQPFFYSITLTGSVPLNINSVSPDHGTNGTAVVVSGSGFGLSGGTGWLMLSSSACGGSFYPTVSSWSDAEIRFNSPQMTVGCSYGVYVKDSSEGSWAYYTRGSFQYGNN